MLWNDSKYILFGINGCRFCVLPRHLQQRRHIPVILQSPATAFSGSALVFAVRAELLFVAVSRAEMIQPAVPP